MMKRSLLILTIPLLAACSPKQFIALDSQPLVASNSVNANDTPVLPTPEPTATPPHIDPNPEPTATPPPVIQATPTPKPTEPPRPPIVIVPPPTATPTPVVPPVVIATPTPKPEPTATPRPPVVVATPTPTPTPDPTQAVDSYCSSEGAASNVAAPVMLPYIPLGSVNLPLSCNNGFEVNNLRRGSIAVNSAGSSARTLAVDIATYTAPDTIQIIASNNSGGAKTLVHLCRVRTAVYSDPTRGLERPPENSIRRWYVSLPAGTTHLTINNGEATTPTYIRVLGLCDFNTNVPMPLPINHYRIVN